MRIPVRSYLSAGVSALTVGAIIAAPVTSLRTRPDTPHPVVRSQQIRLAVSASPFIPRHVAPPAMSVHALAEATRSLESAKSGVATPSGPAKHAPFPVALIASGRSAAVAMKPSQASAPRPGVDNTRPASARSTAIATVDLPGIADVIAHAAQLAIDVAFAEPAMIVGATAFNIDDLLIDVASLNPETINSAFENFIDSETAVLKITLDDVDGDLQSLRESVAAALGVGSDLGDDAAAPAVQKAATGSPADTSASTSDGLPMRKHQSEFGHRGRWKAGTVAGQPSPDVPTKSADDGNTAGQDNDTATTAPKDTQPGDSPHLTTPATNPPGVNNATVPQPIRPTATKSGSASSTKISGTKSGSDHMRTRSGHTGGRPNTAKTGNPGSGTNHRHKHSN
jgi:hypothetical protein